MNLFLLINILLGIPIDMVGGTSIGALVGALYAEELDTSKVETRAQGWARVWNTPTSLPRSGSH